MTASYVSVLPIAYEPYGQDCLATCRFDQDSMLVIDNTKNNRGVMKSHNMGIDYMKKCEADWLIVISAAIRFGEAGGLDFVEALDTNLLVVEAEGVYGWHLIAWHREVFERAGRWDQNFSPYGFDDLDLSWRIQQAFAMDYQEGTPLWDKVPVDVTDMGMAHSIKLAGIDAPAWPRLSYLQQKWGFEIEPGGGKGPFQYKTPFNDPTKDVRWWPNAPDGGKWDD